MSCPDCNDNGYPCHGCNGSGERGRGVCRLCDGLGFVTCPACGQLSWPPTLSPNAVRFKAEVREVALLEDVSAGIHDLRASVAQQAAR